MARRIRVLILCFCFFFLSWQSSGVLQGKKIAIIEGDSVAVACCDNAKRIMHGLVYHEASIGNLQELLDRLNDIQIVTFRQ